MSDLTDIPGGQPLAPPYRPTSQALGQVPEKIPDIPINAVFLLLFILAGAGHMFLLKYNGKHGKKFGISGACFGFSVTRVLATTLRIAWACHPQSIRVAMAAMIFVYAGVVILFISNLFFTQRIIRAQHPHFGWTKPFSVILPVLFAVVVLTILALIVAVILGFYSLDEKIHVAVRDIQVYGATFYAIVAFLPIPALAISTAIRAHPKIKHTQTVDKFGQGSLRAKIMIVMISAFFLTLGASYRAGTTWLPPTPLYSGGLPARPVPGPWYFSRGAFYAFNFTIEIGVSLIWLATRIDKRFIIPDGAKGPFSYGGGFVFAGEPGNEKNRNLGNRDSLRHLTGSTASGWGTARNSRVSWGGSRTSLAHSSRVSWGGVSRENVAMALGEDGIQIEPYPAFEERNSSDPVGGDMGIEGVEAEMGWDPKSGKWALRPVSRFTDNYSPVGTRANSRTETA
nr:hypothetical protein B0A51_09927 [Rachicladosporium sp. CCFEE 5018]